MGLVCQMQNRCPCRNLKCQCVKHCCQKEKQEVSQNEADLLFLYVAPYKKASRTYNESIPGPEIRLEGIQHLLEVKEKGGRCKNPACNGVTVFFCAKCDVNLCLTKSRNCFKDSQQVK